MPVGLAGCLWFGESIRDQARSSVRRGSRPAIVPPLLPPVTSTHLRLQLAAGCVRRAEGERQDRDVFEHTMTIRAGHNAHVASRRTKELNAFNARRETKAVEVAAEVTRVVEQGSMVVEVVAVPTILEPTKTTPAEQIPGMAK